MSPLFSIVLFLSLCTFAVSLTLELMATAHDRYALLQEDETCEIH